MLRRVLLATGVSIWRPALETMDFFRPATEAMVSGSGGRGGKWGGERKRTVDGDEVDFRLSFLLNLAGKGRFHFQTPKQQINFYPLLPLQLIVVSHCPFLFNYTSILLSAGPSSVSISLFLIPELKKYPLGLCPRLTLIRMSRPNQASATDHTTAFVPSSSPQISTDMLRTRLMIVPIQSFSESRIK